MSTGRATGEAWTAADQARLDQVLRDWQAAENHRNGDLARLLMELQTECIARLQRETGCSAKACLEALVWHGWAYAEGREHLRAAGLAIAHRGPTPPCGVPMCNAKTGMATLAAEAGERARER